MTTDIYVLYGNLCHVWEMHFQLKKNYFSFFKDRKNLKIIGALHNFPTHLSQMKGRSGSLSYQVQ